ncbi:UNVERIFIED_CONTAM: Alcohol dehydrogenase-like 4 [Sesamum angustifolium]|uniref:Alcohol dehydrogenase-like 4 n=1 Tax=Sesamum angustifolium TaxID=2727405 RepID=A0AAW2IMH7_9LAMI
MDGSITLTSTTHANGTTSEAITCKGTTIIRIHPPNTTLYSDMKLIILMRSRRGVRPREPLVIEEITVDPPKEMEVRIRIFFTSVCHSDLGTWLGTNEAQRAYPRILGHEASGIVESVGKGVRDVKAGDYVIPIFHGECGECIFCRSESTNMCEKFGINPMKRVMESDGKCRFWRSEDHKPIFHYLNTSTFTQYTVLDSACVVKIDPHLIPLKNMALLSCCITTGVGAAWNTANVKPGSTVAVFGLGSVGFALSP